MQPRQKSHSIDEKGRPSKGKRKFAGRARMPGVKKRCQRENNTELPEKTDSGTHNQSNTQLEEVVSSVAEKMLPEINKRIETIISQRLDTSLTEEKSNKMRRKHEGVTIFMFCVLLQLCVQTNGYQNYTFGENCGNNTRELAYDEQMSVLYKGSSDIVCNGMTFECVESCKVCVSVKHFHDPNCAIRLQFQESWLGATERTITCKKDKENKYCHSSSIFIYLSTLHTKSPANATFDLLLTVEKDETKWAVVGGVIGGVVGGLILMTVIISIIVRKACKLRTSKGHIYSSGNKVPINNKSYPSYSNGGNSQITTGSYQNQPPARSYQSHPVTGRLYPIQPEI